MIVAGTAGHIDHGKTTLVRALTGVDTDRLKVERERGITTELGFAPLDLGGGRIASLVDAPGHERFVRHMIAGAGGLDLALLVVAADEGVMPQTREHLDILGLVGVRRGLVVVTKCDLVPADDLDLAVDDVRGALAGTFLEGAPLVTFAATRPESHAEVRRQVVEAILAAYPEPPVRALDRPFRMAVDRVFVMTGFGAVATGTVTSGQVAVGDELEVLPGGRRGRVRAMQHHGEAVTQAAAGSRAAINLQGLDREGLERGQVLATPGAVRSSAVLDATVTLLARVPKPLKRRTYLMVHTGTTQVDGTVVLLDRDELRPGETGLCQLRLKEEIPTLAGDAYVLRGFETLPGHGRTVGGGRVLNPAGVSRRRDAATIELLAELRDGDAPARARAAIALSGTAGASAADLLAVTDLGRRDLGRALGTLAAAGRVRHLPRDGAARYFGAEECATLGAALARALAAAHVAGPDREAIPAEELRGALPGRPASDLAAMVLRDLAADGRVRETPGGFALRDHAARSSHVGQDALDRVEAAWSAAGLSTPTPEQAASVVALPVATVRDALTALVRAGRMVRIAGDLFFTAPVLEDLRIRLVARLQERGSITTAEFKELAGVTRKYAIPLAEHFDSTKVTLRVSDTVRKLRR